MQVGHIKIRRGGSNMNIEKLDKYTLVTADKNKFLILKDTDNSEKLIGKPVRMIFDNSGTIPEFEERDI